MQSKLPAGQLINLAVVTAGLGNLAEEVLEDGKIGFGDIMSLTKLAKLGPLLAQVDFSLALQQAGDLQPEEAKQITDAFAEELDLANDVVENNTEAVLAAIVDVQAAVYRAIQVVKDLRGANAA